MLKDTLIKCAEILGRDDIKANLESTDDPKTISDAHIQNDITRLISFFNFTVNAICENYLTLSDVNKIKSDSESRIYYHDFNHFPIKITQVADNSKNPTYFKVYTNFITTRYPNKLYYVTYNYVPKPTLNLTDEIILPLRIKEDIICYGVVSEFLASQGQYNQSEYWKDKFLLEIYKIKVYKERRFKSTFYR